jgi:hypothetical protein
VSDTVTYSIPIPPDMKTFGAYTAYAELRIFGEYVGVPWKPINWELKDFPAYARKGLTANFFVQRAFLDSHPARDPKTAAQRPKPRPPEYEKTKGKGREALDDAINKRYWKKTGSEDAEKVDPRERSKVDLWNMYRDEILAEGAEVKKLPPELKDWVGGDSNVTPEEYAQLLRIAKLLEKLSAEDIALFKRVAVGSADNLDVFEVSLSMFLEHKDEIRKALSTPEPPADAAQGPSDTLIDPAKFAAMSERDKYLLAQQKAWEMTGDQFKHMATHPGETAWGFVKGANPVNPETFREIGKDMSEAGDGTANGWARFAGGVGATTKIAGWLLVVGGVVYAVSWLVGVGEIVTLAVALEYGVLALGGLSLFEAELRIKAASQAKTPEEYQDQIQKSASAMTNALLCFAMYGFARGLRFIAKTYFPKTLKSLDNLAERMRNKVRLFNKLSDARAAARANVTEMQEQMARGATAAKDAARAQAAAIKAMTVEEFARKLDSGELFEGQAAPPGEKILWQDLLKTAEGRDAVLKVQERAGTVSAEDLREFDAQDKELTDKLNRLLADVDKAGTHEELNKAVEDFKESLKNKAGDAAVRSRQQRVQERAQREAEAAKAEADAKAAKVAARLKELADTLGPEAFKNLMAGSGGRTLQLAEIEKLLAQHGMSNVRWAAANLSGPEAEALLRDLHPEAVKELSEITSKQAQDLVGALHNDLVNDLAPVVGGKRALELAQNVGEPALRSLLKGPKPMTPARLGELADQLTEPVLKNLATPKDGVSLGAADVEDLLRLQKVATIKWAGSQLTGPETRALLQKVTPEQVSGFQAVDPKNAVAPRIAMRLVKLMELQGITPAEFEGLKMKAADDLTPAQNSAMKAIREGIPHPTADTWMQKVIPAKFLSKYVDNIWQVSGFIAKAEDTAALKSCPEVVDGMRLDYSGTEFGASDPSYGLIRFRTAEVGKIEIPYGKAMGGGWRSAANTIRS